MVYTEEDERYYPCSDQMFAAIINRHESRSLQEQYRAVLAKMLELIQIQIEDKLERSYLESLIMIKHRHETRDQIMIPSRLEKRLITIFLNRTLIEDPYLDEKATRNQRISKVLDSPEFQAAINHIDSSDLLPTPTTVTGIKELAEHIGIKRLLALSVEKSLWESDAGQQLSQMDYRNLFARKLTGNGVKPLLDFLGIQDKESSSGSVQNKKILWLADEAGEAMVDLAIIKYLAKLGHKIIVAFKEGPLFTKVSIDDASRDEALSRALDGVLLITDENMGKTELVKTLRGGSLKRWTASFQEARSKNDDCLIPIFNLRAMSLISPAVQPILSKYLTNPDILKLSNSPMPILRKRPGGLSNRCERPKRKE
jgi:hypothetical protein